MHVRAQLVAGLLWLLNRGYPFVPFLLVFSMRWFVQCKSKSSKWKENGIKNQWRWHWLDTVVDGQRLGTVIRKETEDGQAFCVPCSKTVKYQSKGLAALTGHVARPSHVKKALALKVVSHYSNKLLILY